MSESKIGWSTDIQRRTTIGSNVIWASPQEPPLSLVRDWAHSEKATFSVRKFLGLSECVQKTLFIRSLFHTCPTNFCTFSLTLTGWLFVELAWTDTWWHCSDKEVVQVWIDGLVQRNFGSVLYHETHLSFLPSPPLYFFPLFFFSLFLF